CPRWGYGVRQKPSLKMGCWRRLRQPIRHGAGISVWKMPNATSALSKSIGKFQSMFLFPLWEFLCGGIAPLLAGTLGLRTKVIDSTRYGSGFPAGIFLF